MNMDEPMDIDALDYEKFDDLLEEGEYRESNHISRKIAPTVFSVPENKHENKAGTFVTGIDIFSKEVKMKMEERAKRFGIVKEPEKSNLSEAESLYKSFGINDKNIKNYRLNVIHMRGTENMKTKDIFKYFEDYGPASLEWINDISCNVIWMDKPSAARAILGLSKKITGIKKEPKEHSNDESNDDSLNDTTVNSKHYKDENAIHIKNIRCPLPPGIWRKGNNHTNSRNIFLRFATNMDKKQVFDDKISEVYNKKGNQNQGGLKGILTSSRKRMYKQLKESSPTSKEEPNTNGIAAKNPWGSLSKNWGVTECVEDDYLPKAVAEPISNVRERLGFKTQEKEDVEEKLNIIELSDETQSESSSEEEDWCKRSKMPRMRMHADDEEEKIQKRKGKIRDMVNNTSTKIMDNDLRGKLTAKRRRRLPAAYPEAIQVIVTNPKAVQNNFSNVNITEIEDDGVEDVQEIIIQEDDEGNEEEEGEIVEDSGSDTKVQYVEEGAEIEEESALESDNNSTESSASESEKEVQGPKGSVIKVVQHKPKVASTVSTVWSRLNHSKIDTSDNNSQEKYYSKTDLRFTLRKNALRSRIGNHHMRGRSPLRIELRNDKYAGRQNDSE